MKCRIEDCDNTIHTLIVSRITDYRFGFCEEHWDMNKGIYKLYLKRGWVDSIVHVGDKIRMIIDFYDDFPPRTEAIIKYFDKRGFYIAKTLEPDEPKVYIPYSTSYVEVSGVKL